MPPPRPLPPPKRAEIPLDLYAEPGDIVLWFLHGDEGRPPKPAMVMQADNGRCKLNVFDAGLRDMESIDGTFHADSPKLTAGQKMDAGTWRPQPMVALMRRLLVEQGLLTFDGIELKVATPKPKPAVA